MVLPQVQKELIELDNLLNIIITILLIITTCYWFKWLHVLKITIQ